MDRSVGENLSLYSRIHFKFTPTPKNYKVINYMPQIWLYVSRASFVSYINYFKMFGVHETHKKKRDGVIY